MVFLSIHFITYVASFTSHACTKQTDNLNNIVEFITHNMKLFTVPKISIFFDICLKRNETVCPDNVLFYFTF